MMRRWIGCILWASLGIGGCGDPLLGEDFEGNPVLTFDAIQESTTVVAGVPQTQPRTTISLFWSPSGETNAPLASLIEQPKNSFGLDQPARFAFRVMALPETAHLFNKEAGLGLALILAYVDANDSGRFESSEQERIIGAAKENAIFYSRDDLDARSSPFGMSRKRGVSLLDIPAICRGASPALLGSSSSTTSCAPGDARLGAACQTHAECGTRGLCLDHLGTADCPGGTCVTSADSAGCTPPGAVAISIRENLRLAGCATDAECARTGFACTETQASGSIFSCKICWPRGVTLPSDLMCTALETTAPAGCADRIGAACALDSECQTAQSTGLCLRSLHGVPIPGGSCALPFGSGCMAGNARQVNFSSSYYLAPCLQDADCREAEGYACSTSLRACYPKDLVRVIVGNGFTVEGSMPAFCRR